MTTSDDDRATARAYREATDPGAEDAEETGRALMAEGATRLIEAVTRLGPSWVVRAVTGLVDAYGRLDARARAMAVAAATEAGTRAAARVAEELRELFELDPAAQRATPLEIIRSLRREATEVLQAAGVPQVVRDPYESRAFPDDVYGIVLKTPAELGDDELGGALLAWGLGKAKVVRANRL
ncbi:MAG: hypothetical protein QOJ71_3142 [Actinomycetota bacterium]|nr:hypothetical protein [Actinomycetota bacterium]